MTPPTSTPPPRAPLAKRFGPLVAVLCALALVAVLASTGRDGEQAGGGPDVTEPAGSTDERLPITWTEAGKAGTTDGLDWNEFCDPDTGRVAIPSVYAPPCVAPRPGVDGGATSPGVTATEITIVNYEYADDDLAASLQAQLDPPEARRATNQKLTEMLEARFETWNRKVKVVEFKGTGSDETSARADAVKVADEIGAFASINGPAQEGAYADELASRDVLCIGCGLSVSGTTYDRNAPYMWGNALTPEQFLPILGDYVLKRLLDRKASFAGDPALRERTRVFGSVHFESDPPEFDQTAEIINEAGAKVGYKSAARLTYQLVIPELAEKARTIVSRLKEAGVTTVLFLGDPIMPIYLTKAATDQGYFPEWVITGTVLTDSTTFGRRYDQQQWAHAFGLSPLPAALPKEKREAWALHQWFYGEAPAATKTTGVLFPPVQLLMLGIHLAGPDLTPETFRDGLFAYPPSGGTPTSPRFSFGSPGLLDTTDYTTVDDMTEIWWDADAEGLDEQGEKGTGMMRYTNGGARFRADEMEEGPPAAFREEESVLVYPEVPAADRPPSYPSPAEGGG